MKILFIHNHYQQIGGEQRVVSDEMALLKQHGHDVSLYSRHNNEILDFSPFQKARFFPSTVYSRRTYQEVRALVEAEKPQVAHVHNVFPLISPSVYHALKDSKVPIVQTLHNFRFLCPNGLFYRGGRVCESCKMGNTVHAVIHKCYRDRYTFSALYALAIGLHRHWGTFRKIDKFIAPTEFVKQKVTESNLVEAERISVVGNFLSQTDNKPSMPVEQREPYVVFLGRLSQEKGIEELVEAFRALPEIQLKILGTGPLDEKIKDVIAKDRLVNIQMLGFVDGAQKWQIVRASLAVVIPSGWYEVFPITVIESMAAGTPLVASRHGSLPFTIEDGQTGLYYQYGNVEDLRDKLRWLFSHQEQVYQMGIRAQQTALKKFIPQVHYDQLLHIYHEVLR